MIMFIAGFCAGGILMFIVGGLYDLAKNGTLPSEPSGELPDFYFKNKE